MLTARAESRYHGELNLLARDHRLDARNAFALERPRQQRRTVEGTLTGPVGRSRSWTFLASGSREADDRGSIVYALTPAGLLRQQVPRPERDAECSLRLNYQPVPHRSYSLRYELDRENVRGDDVGGFDLPEVATESNDREDALHLSLQQTHGPQWLHQWQARASFSTAWTAVSCVTRCCWTASGCAAFCCSNPLFRIRRPPVHSPPARRRAWSGSRPVCALPT